MTTKQQILREIERYEQETGSKVPKEPEPLMTADGPIDINSNEHPVYIGNPPNFKR